MAKSIKKTECISRDKEKEEVFVKAFISSNRRKRSLEELDKKRQSFLSRLCHEWDGLFENKYLYEISKTYCGIEKIFSLLCKEGMGERCYVISSNENVDAKTVLLRDALKECVGFGFPSIILSLDGELAYFEAEQEYGPPPRFILKR